jgi:hypothetical protein
LEFDAEGTTKIVRTFSKSVVDSIKLGDMEAAAEKLEDLVNILIKKYDDEQTDELE